MGIRIKLLTVPHQSDATTGLSVSLQASIVSIQSPPQLYFEPIMLLILILMRDRIQLFILIRIRIQILILKVVLVDSDPH
jgi:hypothetical protein